MRDTRYDFFLGADVPSLSFSLVTFNFFSLTFFLSISLSVPPSLPQYLFYYLFLSPSLPSLSLPPSLFSCLFCLPIYPSVLYPLHLLSPYLSLSIFSPSPPLFLSLPRSSLYLIFLPPYFFSILLSIPISQSLYPSFPLPSYRSLFSVSPLSLSLPFLPVSFIFPLSLYLSLPLSSIGTLVVYSRMVHYSHYTLQIPSTYYLF